MPNHRTTLRAAAVGTAVVAASTAVTMGVTAWAAESGEPQPVQRAVTRIGPLPAAASITRGDIPPGQVLDRVKERQHRKAVAAARAARERRAAGSRSAARSAPSPVSYSGDARGIARSMMAARHGWDSDQYSCLSSLWDSESGWDVHASNPSSGAYGIPQALPGSKMATAGSDWENNPATQIAWGLSYIRSSYGTPCGAWSTFRSQGWY